MSVLHRAAAALNWSGTIVTDPGILGAHVAAVVRVNSEIHRWRRDNGWPPEVDSEWVRPWFAPRADDQVPLPAVDLVGILITPPDPQRAVAACGSLLTVAPCAVVVEHSADPWPLIELDYYGIGVVTANDRSATVTLRPEDHSPQLRPSMFGRWIREVLYCRAVEVAPRSPGHPLPDPTQ